MFEIEFVLLEMNFRWIWLIKRVKLYYTGLAVGYTYRPFIINYSYRSGVAAHEEAYNLAQQKSRIAQSNILNFLLLFMHVCFYCFLTFYSRTLIS